MSECKTRIAVDAMGGDNAPDVLVEGSVAALQNYPDVSIVLVGDSERINRALDALRKKDGTSGNGAELPVNGDRLTIEHADEVIDMHDAPAQAIRSKRNSSIVVANKLCKKGQADAIISAGSTGAAMASSLLYLGRIPGVLRPAILAPFPSDENVVGVLDVGANTDCKPEHLYQFAVMASHYMSHVFGYKRPRIGLLNIGEESTKGNDATIAAHQLLVDSGLNFIGNMEGRDIFKGKADVVVCDGFVGNVLLKFGESIFGFITNNLKRRIQGHPLRMAGAILMKSSFAEIKEEMTSDTFGGAPLLGVDGISIICHGNSRPSAIMNAIRVARQLVLEDINTQIKQELEKQITN